MHSSGISGDQAIKLLSESQLEKNTARRISKTNQLKGVSKSDSKQNECWKDPRDASA